MVLDSSTISESKEFLRAILDATTNHVAVIDQAGTILFTNRAWRQFGRENGCLINRSWPGVNYLEICDAAAVAGDEFALKASRGIRKLMADKQGIFLLEYPCHSPDEKHWFMMRVTVFPLAGAHFFSVSHTDITDRKRSELLLIKQHKKLEHVAMHDLLTGLGNRNLFIKQLEHLMALCSRRSEEVALLIMDLNDFKTINDQLGHAAGDQMLQEFAKRLHATLREADQKYRIGGDEFAILLEPCGDSLEGAGVVAEKLSRNLEEPTKIKGRRCPLGASIGIAVFPRHGEDADVLIRKADAAMYEAKKTGKGVASASHLDATAVLRKLEAESRDKR